MSKRLVASSLPNFVGIFESGSRPPSDLPISVLSIPGNEPIVLSRYGDDVWDFSPYIKVVNRSRGASQIYWNKRNLCKPLIESCKAATLAYWKFGAYKSKKRPEAGTFIPFARNLLNFSQWLQDRGISTFNQIDQDTTAAYAAWIRHPDRDIKTSSKELLLAVLETLHESHRVSWRPQLL
ncbi:hypothetical protein, partial [Pseudomonas profundi]|uniref:hypothetical protein n=1 Tax=Pseudomonas profundi TaxID=1981513 RepID=UPI001CC22521